ncbi:hypothetical protein [Aureimonas psammosilenae]|uniref:hypothetical protein n=1 Tax=Aureimonas psammosilenae TaxID=2495496 RepID=UPI0012605803|nr:hypothetical protein [Aureimonas psammosilenae]
MTTVIVPNHVSDAINAAIDEALVKVPEAAPDRAHFYQMLLDHFFEFGFLPEFTLVKKEAA